MTVEGEDPGARREVEGAARRSERCTHYNFILFALVAGLRATMALLLLVASQRGDKALVFKPGDEKNRNPASR